MLKPRACERNGVRLKHYFNLKIMVVNRINVMELSITEQKEIYGGNLLAFIAVIGAVVYVYEVAAPAIIKGFKEGYRSTQPQYQNVIPND
jgi:hypothetical protein